MRGQWGSQNVGFTPFPTNGRLPSGRTIPMVGDEPVFRVKAPNHRQVEVFADLPENGGIDWNLIGSIDPQSLEASGDIATLEQVLMNFSEAKFTIAEAHLLPNPLAAKLFAILQIGVRQLSMTQQSLLQQLKEEKAESMKYKHALKHLSKRQEKSKFPTLEKCPICGRFFKTMEFLDGHIDRRHSSLYSAWMSIRTGKPLGYDGLNDELNVLRKAITQTRDELNKLNLQTPKYDKGREELDAIRILREQQQILIEKAAQDTKQQYLIRQDVRKQIDDAVVSIRQHQRMSDGNPTPTPGNKSDSPTKPSTFNERDVGLTKPFNDRSPSPPIKEPTRPSIDSRRFFKDSDLGEEKPTNAPPGRRQEVSFDTKPMTPIDRSDSNKELKTQQNRKLPRLRRPEGEAEFRPPIYPEKKLRKEPEYRGTPEDQKLETVDVQLHKEPQSIPIDEMLQNLKEQVEKHPLTKDELEYAKEVAERYIQEPGEAERMVEIDRITRDILLQLDQEVDTLREKTMGIEPGPKTAATLLRGDSKASAPLDQGNPQTRIPAGRNRIGQSRWYSGSSVEDVSHFSDSESSRSIPIVDAPYLYVDRMPPPIDSSAPLSPISSSKINDISDDYSDDFVIDDIQTQTKTSSARLEHKTPTLRLGNSSSETFDVTQSPKNQVPGEIFDISTDYSDI